jgi:hypothetical protein
MDLGEASDGAHSASPQPSRRFTPHYARDDLGFLDPARSSELYTPDDLLNHPAVLIKAQPWMGKTYLARRMQLWLSSTPDAQGRFGRYFQLTCFEESVASYELLPPWWGEWASSPSAPPACWVIDGLDECEQGQPGIWRRIFRAINELPDQNHRNKLRIMMLSRDRDWLKDLEKELRELYPGSDAPLVLRLAPLDRQEATRMLGAVEMERVVSLIGRFGLEAIAGYPRVLTYLRDWRGNEELSETQVWRGILSDLLHEHNHQRGGVYQSEPEERFQAASRMAAVSLLSGHSEITNAPPSPFGLSVSDIFPLTPAPDRAKALRRAANDAFRIGGPFRGTPDGGYRFAQRNIRDWFCAFGLSGLSRDRLKAAVTNGQSPQPYFADMLHLLKKVSSDEHVRAWLSTALAPLGPASGDAPWGLEDALCQLDRLEAIAAESPSSLYIYEAEQFRRLEAPGLGRKIADRLRDNHRTVTVRKLLLDIALALGQPEAVEPALCIALDPAQAIELREWATILVRGLGANEEVQRLEPTIARSRGKSRGERDLQAQAIVALLERELWTVAQAARHAPPEAPNVISTPSLLFHEMENRLTADDARLVLMRYLETRPVVRKPGQRPPRPRRRGEFVAASARKLLEEQPLSKSDQQLLVRLAFRLWNNQDRHDLSDPILKRLSRSTFARRCLYSRLVESARKGRQRLPYFFRGVLSSRDLGWLLTRVQSRWKDVRFAWSDLYHRATADPGDVDPAVREQALAAIRAEAPDIANETDRARQEQAEIERERQEKRRQRQGEEARVTLAEAVDQSFNRSNIDDAECMRLLSLLCFSREVIQYRNVDGQWGDLDASRQGKVLAACRTGLAQGEPTSFSDANSFSSINYAEAKAFTTAIRDASALDWLEARLIRTWLPVVLRTRPSDAVETVTACASRSRPDTVAAVIGEIEREMATGEGYMFFANIIPTELWPGAISQRIAAFIDDETLPDTPRAILLKLLTERDSEAALPVALRWSAGESHGNDSDVLRYAALNVRLALDPEDAWPLIEDAYRRRGPDALRKWSFLWQRRDGLGRPLPEWPTARLERLCQMLIESFPLPTGDESRLRSGWVTTDYELQNLRDRAIHILFQRRVEGDEEAAATICAGSPGLQRRLEWQIRQHQAQQLLAGLTQGINSWGTDAGIPVEAAVRLLDDAEFRLIRSHDDLLAAAVHALAQVERDAAFDLSMLYGKNEPAAVSEQANTEDKQRGRRKSRKVHKRLGEDALQAYIRRRLVDLLPSRIPGVAFDLIREHQGKYQRRFDLDILALDLARQLAHVRVEIKWSDNEETETSLTEQLGRKYLLGHDLTHGIYLVGWTGSWKSLGQKNTSLDALREHLARQAAAFTADGEGKSLKIASVVLDLRWREDLPEAELP